MKITRTVTSHGDVRWRLDHQRLGRRSRRYFRSQQEAEAAAQELKVSQDAEGELFASYDITDRIQMVAAFERAREGNYTLQMACDALLAAKRAEEALRVPLTRAISNCLSEKRARNLRHRSLLALESTLNRFAEAHPNRNVGDIHSDDILCWLAAGRSARAGKPWTSRTKNGYLTDLTNFFNWATKRKLISESPTAGVDRFLPTPEEERAKEDAAQILTPAQMQVLMQTAYAKDKGVARLLALNYLGGLRAEREAGLMEERYITETIYVPPRWAKDRQERYFEPHPTLAAWLKATPRCLPLDNIGKREKAIVAAAGLAGKIPRNAGRHSFASYHLALHGKAATIEVLGHDDDQMLFRNYRSVVTKDAAEDYFNVLPQSVGG